MMALLLALVAAAAEPFGPWFVGSPPPPVATCAGGVCDLAGELDGVRGAYHAELCPSGAVGTVRFQAQWLPSPLASKMAVPQARWADDPWREAQQLASRWEERLQARWTFVSSDSAPGAAVTTWSKGGEERSVAALRLPLSVSKPSVDGVEQTTFHQGLVVLMAVAECGE